MTDPTLRSFGSSGPKTFALQNPVLVMRRKEEAVEEKQKLSGDEKEKDRIATRSLKRRVAEQSGRESWGMRGKQVASSSSPVHCRRRLPDPRSVRKPSAR